MSSNATSAEPLKTKAISGAAWTTVQLVGGQLIRLAGNLVLTKLLAPEMFGIMSIVLLLTTAVELFSDIGLHECVIRSKREDPIFLGTALSLQAIRGLTIGAAAWALTTPMSVFYETPVLREIGPFLFAASVLHGLASPNVFVAARHLRVRPIAVLRLSVHVLSLGTMIALASVEHSVWPLVYGLVVDAALFCTASHLFLPGIRVVFRFEAEARKEFFIYGRFLVLSSALTFAANSAGRLVFGKMLGMSVLGVYGIAHALALAPTLALGAIGDGVIFPVYCRILERSERLGDVFDSARRPLVIGAGWALTMVIGGGQPTIEFLYDVRYHGAGWMLQLLGVGGWFMVLAGTYSAALKASGKVAWHAVATAAQATTLIATLPFALERWGIGGGIGCLVTGEVVRYAVGAVATTRAGLARGIGDLWFTLLLAFTGGTCAWVSSQLDVQPLLKLVAVFLLGTALWSPFIRTMIRLARARSEA